jgi:hypothetical protein
MLKLGIVKASSRHALSCRLDTPDWCVRDDIGPVT